MVKMIREIIKGKKVILRPLAKKDFSIIHKWVNDPETMGYWYGQDKPRSKKWIKKHFTQAIEGKVDWSYWIIEVDKIPIGYLCNTVEKDDDGEFIGKIEIDILIGEKKMQERGYGVDALLAMLNYAFKKQKAERVYLVPRMTNLRAIHVYEKVGFKKEGILRHYENFEGKWVDNQIMSILRSEFSD